MKTVVSIAILLLVIGYLVGCSEEPTTTPVTTESEQLSDKPMGPKSITTTGKIGPEGGELIVTDSESPIKATGIRIPAGALSTTVDISITSADTKPKMDGCTVGNGFKIFPNQAISTKNVFFVIMTPFSRTGSESDLHLVFSYRTSRAEWDEEPIPPLPGQPGVFSAAVNELSDDITYYPVVCDMMYLSS